MAPEMGQLPTAPVVVPAPAPGTDRADRPPSRASSMTLASLGKLSRRSSSSSFTIISNPGSHATSPFPRVGLRARLASLLHRRRPDPTPPATGPPLPLSTTPAQDAEMRELTQRMKTASASGDDVRVLQLKYDAIVANASTKPRATDSLFKEACSTDLLFLIDTTGSMTAYIEAAKTQVKSIVADIKDAFFNQADVRIAVVGYKDHGDRDSIQFLDFTPSADKVREFIDGLTAFGGGDAPEDVLGGINQALNASWTQQTRCIIHIADAPPHGRTLNTMAAPNDRFHQPGSEPHHLTHEPLLRQMISLGVNYALLRINCSTDLMAYTFLQAYAPAAPECKLLESNVYFHKAQEFSEQARESGPKRRRGRALLFEEHELGTTYSALRHLVVRSVTTSASRTASRMSGSTARDSGSLGRTTNNSRPTQTKPTKKWGVQMKAIKEDDPSHSILEEEEEDDGITLETSPPQWSNRRFLDRTLLVEAYSAAVPASLSLDDMLASDDNMPITATDLVLHSRSRPFAQGALRVASYARTAASTSPLVVKSFKRGAKQLAHLADDMRVQAVCKAFALEYNGLLPSEFALDFVVATCLKPKTRATSHTGSTVSGVVASAADKCLSLEPFLSGTYIKYNSNSGYVNPESPGTKTHESAQAFSHFTFERSRGRFLVADLQGVDNMLTDPAIHTLDPERFKLADTNLGEAGFKFFFATHVCNDVCKLLGLKSNAAGLGSGKLEFRETWLVREKGEMVCCENKLCRRIVSADNVRTGEEWEGKWCEGCWPQLEGTKQTAVCKAGAGGSHEFEMSKFFYEALGRGVPRECTLHAFMGTEGKSSD